MNTLGDLIETLNDLAGDVGTHIQARDINGLNL